MINDYQKFINYYTEFVFVSNNPEPCDIILVPGSAYPEVAEKAASLYHRKIADKILVSGKFSIVDGYFKGAASNEECYSGDFKTEASFFWKVLLDNGVPDSAIMKEEQAEFTYENALYSKELLRKAGKNIKKAAIVCQAFHARRSLLYYQIVFPETEFIVCPAVTQGISETNWYTSKKGINTVLGEVARCGSQFEGIFEMILKGEEPSFPAKKG